MIAAALMGPQLALALAVCLLAARVWFRLRRANRAADGFEDRFWSNVVLDELATSLGADAGAMAGVFVAGMTELRQGGSPSAAERMMHLVATREGDPGRGGVALRCAILVSAGVGVAEALADLLLGGKNTLPIALATALVVIQASIAAILADAATRRFRARLSGFIEEFAVLVARKAANP